MQQDTAVALILNYRTPDSTYACLESLSREGIGCALVVDNSEDGGQSADELRGLLQSKPLELTLELQSPPRNLGFGAGVNLGLRIIRQQCGPRDVILINSDAKAEPGLVGALRAELAQAGGPALIEAGERDTEGNPRRIIRYYHRVLGLLLHRPVPGAFRYLSGCCLFIPASLAGSPLFDEDFFFYGEDIELSWRMRRAGVPLIWCRDAWVSHVGGRSSRPNSFFYEYHMTHGHLLLARKLARNGFERVVLSALRVCVLGLRAVVRGLRTRRLTALSAWLAVLRARPGVAPPRP